MKPQMLDVHSQHDQCPEMRIEIIIENHFLLHKPIYLSTKFIREYRNPRKLCTVSTLFSSFPGSDEMRQRNTAHDSISGPVSFASKALKLEIVASSSEMSLKEKAVEP